MSTVVVGLGNILLGDEGLGVRAVAAFEARFVPPPGVACVDGGTAGLDLLDVLADRDHAILVDAVETGEPPGSFLRLEGDAVPAYWRRRVSPHQLGLAEVLAALSLIDRRPAGLVLLGLVPATLDGGLALSPTIAARLDHLVAAIAAELARSGAAVRARPSSAPAASSTERCHVPCPASSGPQRR